MRSLIQLVLFLFVGGGLGYCTADFAMTDGLKAVAVSNGPWRTWPAIASPTADPYTRAHFAEVGKLAVTSFEAVTYRAVNDSGGTPLDLDCTYEIESGALPSRWWSITAYDDSGHLIENPAERHSFNNTNLLRQPDGGFRITVSQTAQPGNWLPTRGGGAFRLLLRLYNPNQDLTDNLDKTALPTIHRGTCL